MTIDLDWAFLKNFLTNNNRIQAYKQKILSRLTETGPVHVCVNFMFFKLPRLNRLICPL